MFDGVQRFKEALLDYLTKIVLFKFVAKIQNHPVHNRKRRKLISKTVMTSPILMILIYIVIVLNNQKVLTVICCSLKSY